MQSVSPHSGAQRGRHRASFAGGARMPFAPQDGHKPLHRGRHAGNEPGDAPCGAAPAIQRGALLRIPGVADIMGLLLQPPAEVLPAPQGFIVISAFSDADILVRLFHHDHHMIGLGISVLHQVARPELLPAWPVYPPPRQIAESCIRAQAGPAGAVLALGIRSTAGRLVRRGIDCSVRIPFFQLCHCASVICTRSSNEPGMICGGSS